MASRQEVYAKFGAAAEAAQLIATELGTALLAVSGLALNWHVDLDPITARRILDDTFVERLAKGLKARNRLFHGFYEKHNSKIDTDEGRDILLQDLDHLHADLTMAYHLASAMTLGMLEVLHKDKVAGGRIGTIS